MARGKKKDDLSLEEKLEQTLVSKAEYPYNVPDNWCWIKALFVFDIEYGKGLLAKNMTEEGYPVFGANGQIGYYSEYMFEREQALMSCRGAYSGVMNLSLPYSYVTSNSLIIADKAKILNSKFICNLFSSLNTDSLISGSAQPQVTVQAFQNFTVPIPPVEEQQRIMEQIENLFSKLDDVKEKMHAVIDESEKRKAAILHKAFSGELTEKWRKENNLENDSWVDNKLIDVLISKPRNGYSPKPVDYITPYKSMTLSATSSGVFLPEYYKYVDEQIQYDSYLWLQPGDILIQRANSLEKVGTCAIYTGEEHEFIYPDLMMKLQVKESCLPAYVAYALKTTYSREYFRNHATGTAGNMPKINQKVVSEVPIKIPSLLEQKQIVFQLDSYFEKQTMIDEIIKSVNDKIDEIKKSILAKAFRGELGTNNMAEESSIELLKEILQKTKGQSYDRYKI